MEELTLSIKEHRGFRGVHLRTDTDLRFLSWVEVVNFFSSAPGNQSSEFAENLLEALANYDPDTQALVARSSANFTTIELYPLKVGVG